MRTNESVIVAAHPTRVYPFVADLGRYPEWLPLVHTADEVPVAESGCPAWSVELRARVGPFARSKQLRMELVESATDALAVFERAEVDGRDHARWALRVELVADAGADETTTVTMHLAYDGKLWTGGALERVLDDQIRRGREGLAALVNASQTP